MNADITILQHSMIVHDSENCSVEKAMKCADELGVCYDIGDGGDSITVYGDADQLWQFLNKFLWLYMSLTIE